MAGGARADVFGVPAKLIEQIGRADLGVGVVTTDEHGGSFALERGLDQQIGANGVEALDDLGVGSQLLQALNQALVGGGEVRHDTLLGFAADGVGGVEDNLAGQSAREALDDLLGNQTLESQHDDLGTLDGGLKVALGNARLRKECRPLFNVPFEAHRRRRLTGTCSDDDVVAYVFEALGKSRGHVA